MQGPLSLKNKMLSTPLLNISKASTPVRTRIISSNSALNSTPINQLKFTTTVSRSPASKYNNKQNNINNNNSYHNKEQSNLYEIKKQDKETLQENVEQNIGLGSGRANLSPILALNRKINQGPLSFKQSNMNKQSFRSLTPNSSYYHKNQDTFQNNNNISQSNISINNYQSEKVLDQYGMAANDPNNLNNIIKQNNYPMRESKKMNNFLKSSNSFTNLLESKGNNLHDSRNKTPTRLGSMAFSSLSKKNSLIESKSSSSLLRNSNSFMFSQLANNNKQNRNLLQLTNQFNPNQNLKMSSTKNTMLNSRSFDKSSPLQQINSPKNNFLQNNNIMQESHIIQMCANHQNKKAKYKVYEEEIVYCSKCAMQVVQRGISVEQLQIDQSLSDVNSPGRSYQNYSTYNTNETTNLRQSNTFKNKFQSFKSQQPASSITIINQSLTLIQQLKTKIISQVYTLNNNKQMIEKSYIQSISEIDRYYNSLISYIEAQRQKDKHNIEVLKFKQLSGCNSEMQIKYQGYLNKLDQYKKVVSTQNFNSTLIKQLQEISQIIHFEVKQNGLEKIQEEKRLFEIVPNIQNQFDEFVQVFDQDLKLKYYQTNSEATQMNKTNCHSNMNKKANTNQDFVYQKVSQKPNRLQQNNGLRFSFQKALHNQNTKKKILLQSKMKPLQEQQQQHESQQQQNKNFEWNYNYQQNQNNQRHEDNNNHDNVYNEQMGYNQHNQHDYYEENSFSNQYNNNLVNQGGYNMNVNNDHDHQINDGLGQNYQNEGEEGQQKPFRTLFEEDDQMLFDSNNHQNTHIHNVNNHYSGFNQILDDEFQQEQDENKKDIQSPVFKTR